MWTTIDGLGPHIVVLSMVCPIHSLFGSENVSVDLDRWTYSTTMVLPSIHLVASSFGFENRYMD